LRAVEAGLRGDHHGAVILKFDGWVVIVIMVRLGVRVDKSLAGFRGKREWRAIDVIRTGRKRMEVVLLMMLDKGRIWLHRNGVATILSNIRESGSADHCVVWVTSLVFLELWRLLWGPVFSTMERRLCRLLHVRVGVLFRDVMVIKFLQEGAAGRVVGEMGGWVGGPVPVRSVAGNNGDYAIFSGGVSAVLAIDTWLDVEGGLVVGRVDEMDVLGGRSTGSGRVRVWGVAVKLERVHCLGERAG
jgi:hypothetical protein